MDIFLYLPVRALDFFRVKLIHRITSILQIQNCIFFGTLDVFRLDFGSVQQQLAFAHDSHALPRAALQTEQKANSHFGATLYNLNYNCLPRQSFLIYAAPPCFFTDRVDDLHRPLAAGVLAPSVHRHEAPVDEAGRGNVLGTPIQQLNSGT